MRSLVILLTFALALLAAAIPAHAQFKPGDEVSYTAGGGSRQGTVLCGLATRFMSSNADGGGRERTSETNRAPPAEDPESAGSPC